MRSDTEKVCKPGVRWQKDSVLQGVDIELPRFL